MPKIFKNFGQIFFGGPTQNSANFSCGFLEVVWHKIAKLDAIQLYVGLLLNIDPNEGQNKIEGHISKNVAKMAILWPEIGQRYFGARFSLS